MITDIEELPYPMFETTDEEKQELLYAFKKFEHIYKYGRSVFFDKIGICGYIQQCASLKYKIIQSIGEESYLHHLDDFNKYIKFRLPEIDDCNDEKYHKLCSLFRMIWIGFLLEYKGKS